MKIRIEIIDIPFETFEIILLLIIFILINPEIIIIILIKINVSRLFLYEYRIV